MKMEKVSFQYAHPERILFHFAVLFFVHHWCPAHDEEALCDCHHQTWLVMHWHFYGGQQSRVFFFFSLLSFSSSNFFSFYLINPKDPWCQNWLDSDSCPAKVFFKIVLGWVNNTYSGQSHNIVNFVVKSALTFSRFGHDSGWSRSSNC